MIQSVYLYKKYFTIICGLMALTACEQVYIPSTDISQQEIVVEGYVEVGPKSNPTIVILTKSIPFISTIDPSKFSDLFIRDASVTVNDGDKDVALTQVCLSQIPEELKQQVYEVLGFNPDSNAVDICIYADILSQLTKGYNRTYNLKVLAEGKELTATTTVPEYVPLNNFRWDEPPGKPNDSLSQLFATIKDPAGQKNFYRYFTATGKDKLIPPFNSVIEDAIFDGKEFEFPFQRAQRRGGKFDPERFGLFYRGDSISLKWCTLDKAHYDFWRTRDYSANSGGPFSSYTRISTNIKGGLGIWGGYAVDTYRMVVPPK